MEAKIKLYNVFSEEKSPYHMAIEELYLYSILNGIANQDCTWTSVDIIEQSYLQTGVKFSKRSKEAKPKINKLLNQLKTKHIINYENKNMENSDLLIIKFTNNFTGNKGFEIIPIDHFFSMHDMTDWYIYFTVKRFDKMPDVVNNELGFHCSYDRWANILGCTKKTAVKKVEHAINNHTIYCNIGDYKESAHPNQDLNTYRTTPFSEEEKTKQTKKKEDKKQPTTNESTQTFDTGNWYKKKDNGRYANLEPEDIILYRDAESENEHIDFINFCKKREKSICKTEPGKFMWERLCDEADQREKRIEKEEGKRLIESGAYCVDFADQIIEVTKDNVEGVVRQKSCDRFYVYYPDGTVHIVFNDCKRGLVEAKKAYIDIVKSGKHFETYDDLVEFFKYNPYESNYQGEPDYDYCLNDDSNVKDEDELNEMLDSIEAEDNEQNSWSKEYCEGFIKQYDEELKQDAEDPDVDEMTHEANRKMIEQLKQPYIKRLEEIKKEEEVKRQKAREVADRMTEKSVEEIFG